MAISEISVSKIYILATEPTNKTKDRFWFDTTNNILKRYDGTTWKPISVSSDSVVVLSDGSKISLTTYLNNQIATLAEGIDTKQDKLKFYSEVDKSADTSVDSTGSEINLKTSASQYGGSNINLIASNGQYNPGNINLKAKSYNTSGGGNIILESEGGSASGGNITLHSKVNTGGDAEPGGRINIIAESTQTGNESNISLTAKNIQLKGELSGSGISTYIKGTTPDNESPVITVVDTKVPSEKAVYNALETKQKKLSTYSETIPTDKSYPEEVVITAKGQNLQASNGAGKITLSAADSSDSGDGLSEGTINLNASKVQKNGIDIATATDLANKQDKLQTYSETISPQGGPVYSADINAELGISLDSKQIKIGGDAFACQTIIDGNSKGYNETSKIKVNSNEISLQKLTSDAEGPTLTLTNDGFTINCADCGFTINSNEGITGNILEKTISNSSTDTKIPTAKAVYTAVNANKLTYYSENTNSQSANISTNNTSINVAESGGIVLTAGQSADPGNNKLSINPSSLTLDTTGSLAGNTTNLLTIQNNGKGSISTLSGDLISKSITSSSTDTQIPTAKSVYTAVNAKANKSTTLSGYGITDTYTKTEVNTELSKKQDSLHTYTETSSLTRAAEVAGYNSTINADTIELKGQNLVINNNIISGNSIDNTFEYGISSYSKNKLPTTKFVYDLVDYEVSNLGAGVYVSLGKKQDKLYGYSEQYYSAGENDTKTVSEIQITVENDLNGTGNIILNAHQNIELNGGIEGTAISTSIPVLASSVDTKIPSEKAVRTELNKKQDTLTAGTNISISNNKISVSGLTKSSVGLGNVDNTSDKNKPISTATQTALDAKQNALNYYSENNTSAWIGGVDSFEIHGSNEGLILNSNNGGITIKNTTFKAGQGVISLSGNVWNDGSAILFDFDGQGVAVSDVLLIPEIKNKQDSSDSSLTTNDKTIVGAINELNNQVNTTIPEPITSVYTIGSTNLTSFISNTTYAGVSGQILISADVSNTGPILVGENISDKANAFPIYPDQIFPIPFSDINNFKVTGTVNDKFNYIISFRSLSNTSPVANGGITILNENGYYKLTPEGEGDTATLVITKLK